jgi:flagellar motility protein MotE (MotC chaperone)
MAVTTKKPKEEKQGELLEEDKRVGKELNEIKVKKPKEKKKSKKLFWFFMFLCVVGLVSTAVYFNMGNITEKYLRTSMQKIPIVRNILPPKKEQDLYGDLDRQQLIAQIEQFKKEATSKDERVSTLKSDVTFKQNQIERLQEIEDQQLQFKEDKEEFDRILGKNDPKAFAELYKKMNPDIAATIYKETIEDQKVTKDIKKYTATYEVMDPSSVARIMEEMVNTDLDLVVLILNHIEEEQRGAILGEIEPKIAARVTKRMAPQN